MKKQVWHLYERVYDSILLRLIPYRRLLKNAVQNLNPSDGQVYLDAGCGTGNLIALLLSSSPGTEAVGADFSSAMLKRAAGKLESSEKRVRFVELDLNKELPFEDSLFDGATCLNVLYALSEPQLFIRELNRVLKPGGAVVISTPLLEPKIFPIVREHLDALKAESPRFWLAVFAGQVLGVFFPTLLFILINLFIKGNKELKFYSREELGTLISSAGFELDKVEQVYGNQNWLIRAAKLNRLATC
jgi:ubiquinone/menaquinone biosynthesis C-methylase UbiE